jgi:UDP-N-acetyl-2-amino-2-deoxyglucuronate dehydrogenase
MQGNVTGGGASDPTAIGHKAHQDLFADFLHGIKKNLPSSIDGSEGRKSVELITCIYRSARSGKRVKLKP